MGWTAIPKSPSKKPLRPPGVHALVTEIGNNKHVALRLDWVEPPSWTRTVDGVSVELGSGEHAGKLRLAKGGDHGVPKGRDKKIKPHLRLFITRIADLPAPPIASAPCRFETDGESAVITLPEWMTPGAKKTAPTLGDLVSKFEREEVAIKAIVPKAAPVPVAPAARAAVSMISATGNQPQIMSTAQAIDWGAQRGIPGPKLDLVRINAKRRQLGLSNILIEG